MAFLVLQMALVQEVVEKLAAMCEVGCLNWVMHSNVLSLAMHLILSGPKVLSALRDQQKLGKSLPSSPC